MTRPSAHYTLAVTLILSPLVYMVADRVVVGPFSSDTKAMVIGAILGSVLGGICGVWFGTSAGSQRKDEKPAP